jgi:hypothetical protein
MVLTILAEGFSGILRRTSTERNCPCPLEMPVPITQRAGDAILRRPDRRRPSRYLRSTQLRGTSRNDLTFARCPSS